MLPFPAFSLTFLTFLFLLLLLSPAGAFDPERPNILVLVADDLGWGDVGYHGLNSDVQTPNIDRLGAHGVVLRNFYTHPMCMPARGAFITGRSPWTYGITRETIFPLPKSALLPEIFGEHGYNTSVVGKWDIGSKKRYPRGRFGFEHYYVHFNSHTYLGTAIASNSKKGNYQLTEGEYLTTACGDEAVTFVRQQARESTPFFMWFAPLAPHVPWQAPDFYVNQFLHVQDPLRKMYLATLKALDDEIGKILDALESTGQLENTLVAFHSDNGGLWAPGVRNQPYRGGKLMPTEGGVRAPALLYWPKKLSQGGIYLPEFTVEDLHETILEAAGIPHPEPLPTRRSHWEDLQNGVQRQQDFPVPLGNPISYEMTRDLALDLSPYSAAMKSGKYKLLLENLECISIGNPRDPSPINYTAFPTDYAHEATLYDLSKDPEEQDDITQNHPELLETEEAQAALQTLWGLYNRSVAEATSSYNQYPPEKRARMLENVFCADRRNQHEVHLTKVQKYSFLAVNTRVQVTDASAGAKDSFGEAVMSKKPIGFWRFGDGGADHMADSSGHGNALKPVSESHPVLNPRLGRVTNQGLVIFAYDGLPTTSKIRLGRSFTLQAVFVLPNFPAQRNVFSLSPSSSFEDANLTTRITENGQVIVTSKDKILIETGPGACPGHLLIDLTIVFDDNKEIRLYLNGVLAKTKEVAHENILAGGPQDGYFIILGAREFELLDEFVVYDRGLTVEEIQEHQLLLGTVDPDWLDGTVPPSNTPPTETQQTKVQPTTVQPNTPATQSSSPPTQSPIRPSPAPNLPFPPTPSLTNSGPSFAYQSYFWQLGFFVVEMGVLGLFLSRFPTFFSWGVPRYQGF